MLINNVSVSEYDLFGLFCDRWGSSKVLNRPFLIDNYVYATDGRKLIRVKSNMLENEYHLDKDAPKTIPMPENNRYIIVSRQILYKTIEPFRTEEEGRTIVPSSVCTECDGEGSVTWGYTTKANNGRYWAKHPCPICSGTGQVGEVTVQTGRMVPDYYSEATLNGIKFKARNLMALLNAVEMLNVESFLHTSLSQIRANSFSLMSGIDVLLMPEIEY